MDGNCRISHSSCVRYKEDCATHHHVQCSSRSRQLPSLSAYRYPSFQQLLRILLYTGPCSYKAMLPGILQSDRESRNGREKQMPSRQNHNGSTWGTDVMQKQKQSKHVHQKGWAVIVGLLEQQKREKEWARKQGGWNSSFSYHSFIFAFIMSKSHYNRYVGLEKSKILN